MKSLLKKAAAAITILTLALTAVSPSAWLNAAAASKSTYAQPYPWSKVAGGTTGDYIADSYDNVASGHVFESVTQERLLDILSSKGNYYIVFGSPKNATTQAALSTINAQAKADGITKIYHFDPFIDGYQIDITDSNTVFKGNRATSVNELWTRITELLPAGEPISSYKSSDTLLFLYNGESTPKIRASYSLTDASKFSAPAAKADIAKAFRGGSSAGSVIPGSIRSDFDFFKRVYNASATNINYNRGQGATENKTGAETTEIFTDADKEGFALHQLNFAELVNLLNSPGDHIIFFGASWCHNTQAIIGSVARKAKQYGHQKVYVYDTTVGNQLAFDADDKDKVVAGSSTFNSRNNANPADGSNNISYLYGEFAKYFGNFITENNSNKNNSISYYPNGDLSKEPTATKPWESGTNLNAIRLQLPFLVSYNKDAAKPVTRQWLHKNVANDGTYTEYMLELAWVLKTPEAVAAKDPSDPTKARTIDGLKVVDFASEAVSALDNVLKPDPTYSISLSQSGVYTFPGAEVGYKAQQARSITVNNTGTGSTGALTVALSGTGSKSFTLSKTSLGSIAAGGSDSFTVAPKTGLAAGTYTATVTVSGGNGISESFPVSFTVKAEAKVSSSEPDGSSGTGSNTAGGNTASSNPADSGDENPESPQTGESSRSALWIFLGSASLAAVGVLTFLKKRCAKTTNR